MKHLNEYQNFIVEKLILEQLILESNVIYSGKFRKALSKMPENVVAQKLLEIENKDLDIVSNFFDIKIDNENILTFTPDRIAQQILTDPKEMITYTGGQGGWLTNNTKTNGAIFARLGYEPDSEQVYRPNNTEQGEIISTITSEKTGKTWCYIQFAGGKGVYNKEKTRAAVVDKPALVFSRNRQEIRIGRAVRVILTAYKFPTTDAQIETFVNEFRSVLAIMNNIFSRFEIVSGDDLGFWYHRRNYESPHKGNLGSSCQAVGRLDWLEIYIKNPQTVSLLILKSETSDDKICGRVLLWKLDDGRTLMDCIYTNKDSDMNVFTEYAKAKNIVMMNYSERFIAHIKPEECEKYPSVDNMNNWDPTTGEISNQYFAGSKYIQWSQDDEDEDWDPDYDDDDDY